MAKTRPKNKFAQNLAKRAKWPADHPPPLFATEGAALIWGEVGKRASKCRCCGESILAGQTRLHVHSRLAQAREGRHGGMYYRTDQYYHPECLVRMFTTTDSRDLSCKICRRRFHNWEKPRRKARFAGHFYDKGTHYSVCDDCVKKYNYAQCDNCLVYSVRSRIRTAQLSKNLEVSYCDRCVKREGNDAWVVKEFQRIRAQYAEKGI